MKDEAALLEISALTLIAPKDHLVSTLSHDLRNADRGRLVACTVPSQEQIPSHPAVSVTQRQAARTRPYWRFFRPGGFFFRRDGDLPGRGSCCPDCPGLGEQIHDTRIWLARSYRHLRGSIRKPRGERTMSGRTDRTISTMFQIPLGLVCRVQREADHHQGVSRVRRSGSARTRTARRRSPRVAAPARGAVAYNGQRVKMAVNQSARFSRRDAVTQHPRSWTRPAKRRVGEESSVQRTFLGP